MKNILIVCIIIFSCGDSAKMSLEKPVILNVSFDATRSLYEKINIAFAAAYKNSHNTELQILQSHGGSGKQARSVLEGLDADIVSLALAYDLDILAEKGKLLEPNWATKYPHNSCPAYSIVVFLVRKDNPKNITDWKDLERPDVIPMTANPKTSGGARWNFLALWSWAKNEYNSEEKSREIIQEILSRIPVLPSGSRAALASFTKQKLGDVLLAWESDALQITKNSPDYKIIYPSQTMRAETPVAEVSRITNRRGSGELVQQYLKFLFSAQAQKIYESEGFRSFDKPLETNINLHTIEDFGNWPEVQVKFFNDGGIFDQIYEKAMAHA